jgi:hypothetical protein
MRRRRAKVTVTSDDLRTLRWPRRCALCNKEPPEGTPFNIREVPVKQGFWTLRPVPKSGPVSVRVCPKCAPKGRLTFGSVVSVFGLLSMVLAFAGPVCLGKTSSQDMFGAGAAFWFGALFIWLGAKLGTEKSPMRCVRYSKKKWILHCRSSDFAASLAELNPQETTVRFARAPMTLITGLLAFLVLLAVVTWAVTATGRLEFKEYSSPEHGFSISLPSDWEQVPSDVLCALQGRLDESCELTLAYWSRNRLLNVQINRIALDDHETLDELYELATLRREQADAITVSKTHNTIGELNAISEIVSMVTPAGKPARSEVLYLVQGSVGWVLIVGGEPESFDVERERIDHMLGSFRPDAGGQKGG